MDFADSTTISSPPSASASFIGVSQEEHCVASASEDHETTCWACGVHLLLSPYAPVFKCGWCGAISNHNAKKCDNKYFWWRRFRDHCFVCVVLVFMFGMICGGVWAIYPVVFSISNLCGIFHSLIAMILSISTISMFSLAAFRCPGVPPSITWGSYSVVGKDGLENFTFCYYCSKPKSPRTHHCRSCGMCVLDMDHHCPFIGNCVGAANHRTFVLFLISSVVGTIYLSFMSAYSARHIWPPLNHGPLSSINKLVYSKFILKSLQHLFFSFLRSTIFLSPRGFILVYLFIASVSVAIGLSILLWQQLCYIYEGNTYLDHLSSNLGEGVGKGDCQNIYDFFGFPCSASRYLPSFTSIKNLIRLFGSSYPTLRSLPCFFNSEKSHDK